MWHWYSLTLLYVAMSFTVLSVISVTWFVILAQIPNDGKKSSLQKKDCLVVDGGMSVGISVGESEV